MKSRSHGFTLMELIGVLAVMAILASVIAPNIFDAIDRAYAEAETSNLRELSGGLISHILDNKQIPRQNTASWVTAVANYGALSDENVEFNPKGYRRRLYVDPRFFTTTDTVFPGYIQSGGLTTPPNSPRMMLVSDLSTNAPAPPNTGNEFDDIWNQVAGATVVEGPKVKIERINLRGNFHRVLLTNAHTLLPAYGLENQAASAVPPAVGGLDGSLTRYVIHSTELKLFSTSFPTGGLSTSMLVTSDAGMSFGTDGASWYWERL